MSIEAEVLADYLAGMPERDLLTKYGIKRKDVNRIRKRHGVGLRHCNLQHQRRKNEIAGETVTCMACGRQMQNLSSHVRVHGLTPDEYVDKHGGPLATATCQKLMREAAVDKFERRPGLKDKLREIGSRNITKVNADGKGWRTPVGFWSKEQRAHMSRLLMGRQVTWANKIKESHWSKGDKAHDVIDAICAHGKRFKRGWHLSTKTGAKEFYHSSYELRRMKELDADPDVQRWSKRHGIVVPYQHAGRDKNYVPDFLIERVDGLKVIEEVKGYVIDQAQHDAKCSAARIWCPLHGYVYLVNFMGRSL